MQTLYFVAYFDVEIDEKIALMTVLIRFIDDTW